MMNPKMVAGFFLVGYNRLCGLSLAKLLGKAA